ncbi:HAD hydrolase-like protein [Kiritimatiellaeota bacterium B1221]|nr:HAD hydrolase-like protein [Kiritimatiellaeota bacterium B1221]
MNFTFTSHHDFLVAVDSDGCVFDTMEVKQHGHFHPLIMKHWGLESLRHEIVTLADHVNLHSQLRGSNRFVALHRTFELLVETQAYAKSGIALDWVEPLGKWVQSEANLHHETLKAAAEADPRLQSVLDWSLAVNKDIAENMGAVPSFDGVREALTTLRERADLVVVSLSPHHALQSEWGGAALTPLVNAIAGFDVGGKPHQLTLAMAQAGVSPERVILIGDAPGDLKAAREVGISFYPTLPGKEAECWQQFVDEEFEHFLQGNYRGEREAGYIQTFEQYLSEEPPQGL